MLRELRVWNFAVVEEATLELGPGLTVLSGETGAGKSVLIEALALLVGGRPSADAIRAGAATAAVEGRFEADGAGAAAFCGEAGFDLEDGWLILRRELRRAGRNRAWINGSPSTTGMLRNLGARLMDLHGQHEHQRLLDRKNQLLLLDAHGRHEALAARVRKAFADVRALSLQVNEARAREREGIERADYLRFKRDEIAAAELVAGEEDALAVEERRLAHSEELIALASTLYRRLYDSDESVVDQLGDMGGQLARLASIDPEAARFGELGESALRNLEEVGRGLAGYRDLIEHDPQRLDEIRARMDVLSRLKRKYGGSVQDVIRTGEEARRELESIEGAGDEVARLEELRGASARKLERLAGDLSVRRRAAAGALADEVTASLPGLGMPGGRMEVSLPELGEIAAHGAEGVEFLVSLNPGFPPAPLRRIASGGEMSRLMLAIETALIKVDPLPVLVFDEVDAGVGGEVSHRVAARLVGLSSAHQVLVVTHLPQVAARADMHYSLNKVADEASGRARTRVRPLTKEERVVEVARMLGGNPDSEKSRAHAEELLSHSLAG